MEQLNKRLKLKNGSFVDDIASSISDISESINSISQSYGTLLKVNRAVVLFMQDIKKRQEELSLGQLQSDLEQITLEPEP